MASISTRRLLQRSTAAVRASLSRTGKTQSPPSVSSGTSNVGGLAPSNPAPSSRLSRPRRHFSSTRLPVELGCGDSLMPLHSATASALLNSMLSSKDLLLHYSRAFVFIDMVTDPGPREESTQKFSLFSSSISE
ncbi:hypothetical protein RHGRI_028235 [Rhododendron griersonianum]|uniref:Protein NUCLEAR FUSION DEFECTIVE 6, chloroplastic/mitochondrial-like n=1 Tax=Rhododendron griersonianum TaxID=479676 RepID=A0AAV6IKY5_9ERIC|nr:hypothetical protein RHGRI_028235 [Rhododendron griersonianum]